MVESEDLAEDVRKIRWHQEAIDANVELITRAHSKELLPEIMEFFGNIPRKKKAINRAKVFIAIDSKRTVSELASTLELSISQVSQEITKLKEMGLIEIKESSPKGLIYKKRKIDTILKISQKLIKDFGITIPQVVPLQTSMDETNE
ncbi:MAG: ArsR family transcriptional regulator [archaeon]|nr:ArsR family transcriptional regulator [archaeon]MCP8312982.1 ArsR family transcriptional regulator [archaeon]